MAKCTSLKMRLCPGGVDNHGVTRLYIQLSGVCRIVFVLDWEKGSLLSEKPETSAMHIRMFEAAIAIVSSSLPAFR